MADAARLLALAEAVADGQPIDWPDEEHCAPDEQQDLIRQLRLIAGVATTHRSEGAAALARERAEPPPTSWGTLDIQALIGRGSFGSAYRAWDRRLARPVALKLLHGDHPDDSEIIEEGRLLAQVRHPNVITVHGADRFSGRVGIWMELVDGRTLQQIVAEHGAFGAQEAALVGLDVASALAAVHRAGLIHGDVKAQNVMREKGGRTVLMDFGAGTERDTPQERRVGTPLYMAPEVLAGGGASARSDIYALGVLLFYLVTRQYPVTGATTAEVRAAHASSETATLRDLRPDLPSWFVRVVDRAIAADPATRWRSAGELQAALAEGLQSTAGKTRAIFHAWWPWLIAAMALLAAALGGGMARLGSRSVAASVQTIAVLPLANLTGDQAQDYVAAGLTDVLVANLGRMKSLRVIPIPSGALTGDGARARVLAGLKVDAVLEASIQRTAERVRVSVRLVQHSASNPGAVLWSQWYEGPSADAFPIQGRIAIDLTQQLGAKPDDSGRASVMRYTPSQEVQDAYLRARYLTTTGNRDDIVKARTELERAIALDPSYAPAHATLASTYLTMGTYGLLEPADVRARALHAAQRAVELDPGLSEAVLAMADVRFRLEWNWAEAERAYTSAIDLNPSDIRARSRYARYLAAAGRTAEALEEARRAYALDPLSEEIHALVGLMMYYERRYEDAIQFYRGRPRTTPGGHVGLGRACTESGRYAEAIQEFEEALHLSANDPAIYAELGRAAANAGDIPRARQVLDELRARRRSGTFIAPQDLAYIHAALGERDEALRLLNEAVSEQASRLLWLGVDPRVDILRSDTRFLALMKRLGIPG